MLSARKSMDLMSVSAFKLDLRGRLEGGVRPAPPSTEPPAYVRLTLRGSQARIECARHGKDTWCLHAVILALHHLGAEPIYRTVAVAAPQVVVGFQLVALFSGRGLDLRLKSRSTASYVAHPARVLKREFSALSLTETEAEQLAELGREDAECVHIQHLDVARALEILKRANLVDGQGRNLVFKTYRHAVPRATLRIANGRIHATIDPTLGENVQVFPGWPGYLLEDAVLYRVSGYLANLQSLIGKHDLPLDPDHLLSLLRERHGIVWATPKPELVQELEQPALDLTVQARELRGQFGVWHGGCFFAFRGLQQGRQLLTAKGRLLLTDLNDLAMGRLREQIAKLRLPLEGEDGFTVRERQAPEFLERTSFPESWHVARDSADHHFGQVNQAVSVLRQKGSLLPRYQVGDQVYEHDFLMAHLLESRTGARLPNGQVLKFDARQVRMQRLILDGVEALHQDEARRADLLARITEGRPGEPGPELEQPWRSLLRAYQNEGVRWMSGNLLRDEPALLADDMGLGKTIQTLALLDSIRQGSPQLVVVPTSLLANWREEVGKFCGHRQVLIHHGPKRTKSVDKLADADLVLTSYGTLLRDQDLFYDVQFQVVVLDEAQNIKNAASRTAQAVAELWCDHRLALTGTPIENRLTELWAIFQFLAPGYLGTEDEVKLIGMPGSAPYEALKAKVKPFMLRRKKETVASELPAKQEVTVILPMEEAQEQLYQRVLSHARSELAGSGNAGTISILTRLLRLRQASCHPGLLDEGLVRAPSNKINYLVAQLQEISAAGHAALVFSQFTQLLALVRFALEDVDLPYVYLDGRTRDRQAVVNRFQAGEAPIFLISLKAGGVGLNLTRASYVYHLDPWWNPAVEAQATDRAHRIGQTRHVFSYKLISKDTVEERILRLQSSKRILSEGMWQDAEQLIAQLDRDALMDLLS